MPCGVLLKTTFSVSQQSTLCVSLSFNKHIDCTLFLIKYLQSSFYLLCNVYFNICWCSASFLHPTINKLRSSKTSGDLYCTAHVLCIQKKKKQRPISKNLASQHCRWSGNPEGNFKSIQIHLMPQLITDLKKNMVDSFRLLQVQLNNGRTRASRHPLYNAMFCTE